MKIFRHQEDNKLFLIQGLTEEQLIAENDINRNYRSFLETILAFNDSELANHAPGDPKVVRENLKLQVNTCMQYEKAFGDALASSQKQKPKHN